MSNFYRLFCLKFCIIKPTGSNSQLKSNHHHNAATGAKVWSKGTLQKTSFVIFSWNPVSLEKDAGLKMTRVELLAGHHYNLWSAVHVPQQLCMCHGSCVVCMCHGRCASATAAMHVPWQLCMCHGSCACAMAAVHVPRQLCMCHNSYACATAAVHVPQQLCMSHGSCASATAAVHVPQQLCMCHSSSAQTRFESCLSSVAGSSVWNSLLQIIIHEQFLHHSQRTFGTHLFCLVYNVRVILELLWYSEEQVLALQNISI